MAEDENEQRGVFANDTAANATIYEISEDKNAFIKVIEEYTPSERIQKLKNLFTNMQILMLGQGITTNDIQKVRMLTKNGERNFFEAKGAIDSADDVGIALEVCEVGVSCYERIIKMYLNRGISTTRLRWDRKSVDYLFSSVHKPQGAEVFFNDLKREYHSLIKQNIAEDSILGEFAFWLWKLPMYDQAPSGISCGWKRIGKGTLIAWIMAYIIRLKLKETDMDKVWKWMVDNKIAETCIIYNDLQIGENGKKFEKWAAPLFNTFVDVDDGLWILASKKAMSQMNITVNTVQQTNADHNNWGFTQIQSLKDLEKTVIRGADYLIRHWEQGRAYVFGNDDPFAIGEDKFDSQRMAKETWITKSKRDGQIHIPKLGSFMFELKWSPLDNCLNCHHKKHHLYSCKEQNGINNCSCVQTEYICENIFFREVMKWKRYWQAKKGITDEGAGEKPIKIENKPIIPKPQTNRKDFMFMFPMGIPWEDGDLP